METLITIIVWCALVVIISAALCLIVSFFEGAKNAFSWFGKPNDCPFMFGNYVNYFKAEMFLRWVWYNRRYIEPAFMPYYTRYKNEWYFFITRPYVLGGWMFITCADNGVNLNIAHNEKDIDNSYSKSSYCPNWPGVSHSSKILWKKVSAWFDEQNRIADEKYDKDWINPLILNQR